MPRRPRQSDGGLVYHVLNRAVGRMMLFETPPDYEAFERVLAEVVERSGTRLVNYVVMPNHWHLTIWPRENGELSEVLRWLTVTHAQRWHAHRQTAGTGPIYQGRFKSFPVQSDEHFLVVARYVERNLLRAGLVKRAENWRWSSLWRRLHDQSHDSLLSRWPVAMPPGWTRRVNAPLSSAELNAARRSVVRGQPFGNDRWVRRISTRLSLESTLRPRGRPKKSKPKPELGDSTA